MLDVLDVPGAERWMQSCIASGFRERWDYADDSFTVVIDVKLDFGSITDGGRPMSATVGIVAFPNDSSGPYVARPILFGLTKNKLFEAGREAAESVLKAVSPK